MTENLLMTQIFMIYNYTMHDSEITINNINNNLHNVLNQCSSWYILFYSQGTMMLLPSILVVGDTVCGR